MKKVMFMLLVAAGISSTVNAQAKTVTIKTPTVQCEECKHRIENYLAKEEGIMKAVVDYKRKITKVTYTSERTNVENIKTAIANAGYDADDVTANTDSYNKLPKCCKKTEDGGGTPKKN